MWQKIIRYWQEGFGLETKFFRLWLANIAAFIFIGIFAVNDRADLSTYYFSTVLIVIDSLILFLLVNDTPKIKIAMMAFLIVLNALLFGYYYFTSIAVFF